MNKNLRMPALAVVSLVGMGASAQAAAIDFEDLAKDSNGNPITAPLPLTGQVPGFAFGGAFVYNVAITSHPNYLPAAPIPKPATNGAGFIQSAELVTAPAIKNDEIAISLAGANAGRDIQSMTFDLANGGTNVEIVAVDGAGPHVFNYNPGIFWTWTTQTLDFSNLGVVSSIEFITLATTEGQYFALDNLNFTLAPVPGVPEPSSLGLLALGLAATGLASRRRRHPA